MSPVSDNLAGVKVVDLTRNLAGPYCTMLLADLGADVVKVETPGTGDDTRRWNPPDWDAQSATFLAANRGKQSIAVDLDVPEGQQIVRRLAQQSDVVVSSFRPESLHRRHLDYETLRADSPALIYCSISAYGARGPKRDWPGYDPVLQAESGLMALTGYPDGPPARLGVGAIDLGTALWAALGIQAALRSRDHTGEGSLVEVSLYETAAWWLSYHIAGFLGSGDLPSRQGTEAPFLAPYEVFETADGHLMVCAGNDSLFEKLCRSLEAPELAQHESFRTNRDRVANRRALHALLETRFKGRPATEWQTLLRDSSVPCSPVGTVADFVADDQLAALGLLQPLAHPEVEGLRLIGTPMSIDAERPTAERSPPVLGQDTLRVLAGLGYTDVEIRQLVHSGTVAAAQSAEDS